MRIFFAAIVVILAANLGIELLDSNMTQIIVNITETCVICQLNCSLEAV